MFSHQIDFEWREGESAYLNWASSSARLVRPLQDLAINVPNVEARYLLVLLRRLVILLLVMTVAESGPFPHTLLAAMRTRQAIEFSLTLEEEAQRTGDATLFATLLDAPVAERLGRELLQSYQSDSEQEQEQDEVAMRVLDIQEEGEMATVQTQFTYKNYRGTPFTFQRYRFYRYVNGQWLRTIPEATFWGGLRRMQTKHLNFEYTARDANAVEAAAPTIDLAYRQLHHLIGTPLPATRILVKVEPSGRRGWTVGQDRLTISSPLLMPSAVGQTQSTALLEPVVSNFIFFVLSDLRASGGVQNGALWNVLFPGLHSWLLQQITDQPALLDQGTTALLQQELTDRHALVLSELVALPGGGNPSSRRRWRTKAVETIFDYVTQRYGPEQIGMIVRAMGHHSSLNTLIPDLYGVSIKEFEQDWNRFLVDTYLPEK